MKKINQIPVFFLILCFFLVSCGESPIAEFNSYTPNMAPVIVQFTSDYNGEDIVPGLHISLHVEAYDPEGSAITYEFISAHGSFTDQDRTRSNGICSAQFILGNILPHETVTVKVRVSDSEGNSSIQSLDIGTGKAGPRITQLNEINTTISSDECSTVSFSSDSDGYYQVLLFDDPATKSATIDETKTMFLIAKDEQVSFDICGPHATNALATPGIPVLNPASQTPDNIILIVSDKMRQESALVLTYTIAGTSPQLPANSSISVTAITASSISVSWSPAIDSETLQQDLEYKVYYSKDKELNTLQDIETNGTASGEWVKSIGYTIIRDLQHSTTYYINVVVRDEEDNRTAYTMQTASTILAPLLEANISPELNTKYNTVIPYTQVFTITFNKPIAKSSFTISGTMAAESTATWSPAKDKITVSPTTTWAPGGNKSLDLSCIDPDYGTPYVINIMVDILDQNVYVHNSGHDMYPGTWDLPKASIAAAIYQAKRFFQTANVKVAEGAYQVNNNDPNTYIKLEEGISVYGGYSPTDWDQRDPATYVSDISDLSISGTLDKVIDCGTEVTNATIFDGFSLNSWNIDLTYAVFCSNSSPTIQNNQINGNAGVGIALYQNAAPLIKDNVIWGIMGIVSEYSSPVITNNEVRSTEIGIHSLFSSCIITNNFIKNYSGVGIMQLVDTSSLIQGNTITTDSGEVTAGLFIVQCGSAPVIRNNTIFGGNGSTSSTGIDIQMSDAIIQNNTISGGNSSSLAIGIALTQSTPTIENNIIFTSNSGTAYCINEMAPDSDPAVFHNNVLFRCDTGRYHDAANGDLNAQSSLNEPGNLTGSGSASGNLIDDLIANSWLYDSDADFNTLGINDWSLLGGVSITQGGLPLSGFSLDKSAMERTAPWSIGAYEKD